MTPQQKTEWLAKRDRLAAEFDAREKQTERAKELKAQGKTDEDIADILAHERFVREAKE